MKLRLGKLSHEPMLPNGVDEGTDDFPFVIDTHRLSRRRSWNRIVTNSPCESRKPRSAVPPVIPTMSPELLILHAMVVTTPGTSMVLKRP